MHKKQIVKWRLNHQITPSWHTQNVGALLMPAETTNLWMLHVEEKDKQGPWAYAFGFRLNICCATLVRLVAPQYDTNKVPFDYLLVFLIFKK